jgi:hypothetical protein
MLTHGAIRYSRAFDKITGPRVQRKQVRIHGYPEDAVTEDGHLIGI